MKTAETVELAQLTQTKTAAVYWQLHPCGQWDWTQGCCELGNVQAENTCFDTQSPERDAAGKPEVARLSLCRLGSWRISAVLGFSCSVASTFQEHQEPGGKSRGAVTQLVQSAPWASSDLSSSPGLLCGVGHTQGICRDSGLWASPANSENISDSKSCTVQLNPNPQTQHLC